MGSIEKRNGKYRAHYRDPLRRKRSKTFSRKADVQRFLVEMESAKSRGAWINPAGHRHVRLACRAGRHDPGTQR